MSALRDVDVPAAYDRGHVSIMLSDPETRMVLDAIILSNPETRMVLDAIILSNPETRMVLDANDVRGRT